MLQHSWHKTVCTNTSEPVSDAMMWLLQGAAATRRERAEADLSNEPVSANKQSMLQEAVDLHEKLLVSLSCCLIL